MNSKYKFHEVEGVYFVTSTVVGWIDLFTRDIYRDILLYSFRFCQKNQNLQLHAWVLMPNHFHLICSFNNNANPGIVLKNIKSFTAIKIIDAIINNPTENRKQWMLDMFEKNGKKSSSNFRFQFWQHENQPILLNTKEMYEQRFVYLHENPNRAGFVNEPHEWKYSSAIDYYTQMGKGLLELVRFD